MDAAVAIQVVRFNKRVHLFERRGVTTDEAWDLAEKLWKRDAELDSRRMCIECSHLQRDGVCFAARQGRIAGAPSGLTPVKNMLQRCERFEWQTP